MYWYFDTKEFEKRTNQDPVSCIPFIYFKNSDVEIGGGIGKGIVGDKNEHPDGSSEASRLKNISVQNLSEEYGVQLWCGVPPGG